KSPLIPTFSPVSVRRALWRREKDEIPLKIPLYPPFSKGELTYLIVSRTRFSQRTPGNVCFFL
ncbi:MAG TPA: hypothetical protein P5150_08145, partial [Candidatus Ratteibacteria bacterium]|nr:hypothetical protein [Candidatus Ratteibacteria bacterium]